MVRVPLVLAFLAAIALQIGLPTLASVWAVTRLKVGWAVFGYGVLTFAVVGLALMVPLSSWYARSPAGASWVAARIGLVGALATLGLVTAVAEQVARYLGFRLLFRDVRRTWRRAVVFGLGYGSLQSVYLAGLPAAIALANAIALPPIRPEGLGLTPQEAMSLRSAQQHIATMAGWLPLADGAESALMLGLQVGLSVLVVQAFLRASRVWLVYATGLHLAGEASVLLGEAYAQLLLGLLGLLVVTAGVGYWALRLRPAMLPSTASYT